MSGIDPTIADEGASAVGVIGARTPAARIARFRLNDPAVAWVTLFSGVTTTPDDLVIELEELAAPLAKGAHAPLTLELTRRPAFPLRGGKEGHRP